ncbi:MAG: 3-phosphoshikimate 1-carboxyvinyltransferase [Lachnospiraceae bacterium]|nr:3-phosphoshikimate 1-carboxyvinyltransferase [Lachnospiraceae bacterium]
MKKTIKPVKAFNAVITIPGDKSISHRAVMFGSLAVGDTVIRGFLNGDDCLSTVGCFKNMGIDIEMDKEKVVVHGKGLNGLTPPVSVLDVGNSGTTLRLMSGILSAQKFTSCVTGDSSIQKRPMDRVAKPLSLMGADIKSTAPDKILAPVTITGKPLKGIDYTLPVASAQVKSAILLAGLYAEGETVVIEPEATRNHTEIMLNFMGADIKKDGNRIICRPVKELYAKEITVPGDISSAAYFMVAAATSENACITIKNVGINPTRTGIITALEAMGADITISDEKLLNGEPVGDITVKSSKLKATVIEGDLIPKLIDEIPVLAVAAAMADGTTVIKDAQELKVKESNRIKTTADELSKFGVDITETDDGLIINGPTFMKGGAVINTHNDHRIAMSAAIAALLADSETVIDGSECVDISFPGFYTLLEEL